MMSAVIGCPAGGSAITTHETHFSGGSSRRYVKLKVFGIVAIGEEGWLRDSNEMALGLEQILERGVDMAEHEGEGVRDGVWSFFSLILRNNGSKRLVTVMRERKEDCYDMK